MEKRKFKTGQVREFLEDSRTVRFVISDESKDRHKSVVKADAWDLENFKENPIAGWGHAVYGGWRAPDPDDIIGRWDVWIEGKELLGDLHFEDAETNPKAEKLYRKVQNGTLNSVSVGFLPKKQHEGDPEEREFEEKGVLYYDDVELIEASLVVIPSNPNAKKKALENGDIPELAEELIHELKELVSSALGDKLNDDDFNKLTLRGLITTLRGDAPEIKDADVEIKIEGENITEGIKDADTIRIENEKDYYNKLINLLEDDTKRDC